MGRMTKQGIDYFSLDVQFDDKVELYLLETEAIGLAVFITLLQMIYQNEGYYIKYKDVSLLIKKRINVDINKINGCINVMLERGLLDKTLYEKYGVLTSTGIQKRYFDAAKRKKIVRTYSRYLLIDNINDYINIKDVDINPIIVGENATKVNVKEKVKVNVNVNVKEKVKVNVKEKNIHPLILYVLNNLPNVSKLKSQLTDEECKRLLCEFPKETINEVLLAMENKNDLVKKYNSVNLTLRNWLKRRNSNGKNSSPRGSVDFNKWDRELKAARGETAEVDPGRIIKELGQH